MDEALKAELIALLEKAMRGAIPDSSGEPNKSQTVVNNSYFFFSSDCGGITAFKLLLQAHNKAQEPLPSPEPHLRRVP